MFAVHQMMNGCRLSDREGGRCSQQISESGHRCNERQAVIDHDARMFYFSKNDMSGQQMATTLKMALPGIRKLYAKQPLPFFAAITRTGEVYLKEKFTTF